MESRQLFLFADCETYKEPGEFVHNVNLVVVFKTCSECIMNFEVDDPLQCCGQRKRIFIGEQALTECVDYMFFSKDLKGAIVFFHYGGR